MYTSNNSALQLNLFAAGCLFALSLYAQPTTFESKGMCGGGATTQPSISPFNDQLYYVTSDMSPVLRSENAGADWSPIPHYELMGKGQHTRIEFTSDPNILYSFGYTGYPKPHEPKKSIDGGITWDVLPTDPTNGNVWQLFADPTSTQRVLLTDYSKAYISIDGGNTFSTIITSSSSVYIGGVFWDNADIYIAANSGETSGSALLWISNDSGATFNSEPINGDFPNDHFFRYMEGVKVGGQVKLYAVTMYSSFGGLNFTEYWGPTRKVLRLDYGAGNWSSLDGNGLSLASGGGATHPNIIGTCDSDPEVVYLGCYHAPGMEVYKSINGGNSWTQVLDCDNFNQNINIATGWIGAGSSSYNWWWSGPVIGLEVAKGNSDVVIITDYMSSHHTRNGGNTWEALFVIPSELNPIGVNTPDGLTYESNGLEITSCWDLHWFSPDDVIASYTDLQGFISHDAGNSWSNNYSYPVNYNTTYTVVPSPSGSKAFACVSDKHDMYGSSYLTDALIDPGVGEIFETSDNGLTWNVTHDFGRVVMDMAIDANNTNRFYACIANSTDGGIYYSDDYGITWSQLSIAPRTEGHPIEIEVLADGTLVAVFSARYNNSQFTASSGVFVSEDNGLTWIDRSDVGMHYWTMDLEIAPNNDSVWYASVRSHWGINNLEQGGVYRSTDRGQNWVRIKDFYRVWSMTIHPTNPDIAYVCTHDNLDGLQYTENLTSATPIFERVDAYHFANPNRVVFNPYDEDEIWVTSFGNGLKKGINSGSLDFIEDAIVKKYIYPNPTSSHISIKGDFYEPMRFEVLSLFGEKLINGVLNNNDKVINLSHLSPNIYFVKIGAVTYRVLKTE